jgi:hypothetical protein
MTPPGGPGNFGAVQAGDNVTIDPATGAVSTPPGGVTRVLGAGGISVNPPEGKGLAVTLTLPVPSVTPFTAGTTVLIMSSSAPPGYSKSTGFDDYALRVVTGSGGVSGGSVAYSSVFTNVVPTGTFSPPGVNLGGDTSQSAWTPTGTVNNGQLGSVQSTSIGRGENNSHSHQYNLGVPGGSIFRLESGFGQSQQSSPVGTIDVGDNGSHSHNLSFSVGWSGSPLQHQHSWSSSAGGSGGTFTGSPLGLGIRYVDAIICVKN